MNNNMAQAKTPDHEGDWESIDIFLFSNGQQYSPPRKHHLRAEELTWWSATLSNLAKSQFGFKHSVIELHTLDGRKVEGPLELSNGGAYVAVEPPDKFIDSGYDKYLIKATRSWEKRQAKKSISVTMTPDAISIPNEDPKMYVNTPEVMSIKAPEDNVTSESIIQQPIPIPLPNVSEAPQQAPKPPSTTKPVEKKRTSLSQRVTTFRKVNPPSTPPPAKRLSLKPSPPKKFTKPPNRTPNTPQASLIAKSRIYAKSVFNKSKEQTGPSRTAVKKSTSLTRINSNYKMMGTDSLPMDVICDKDIILMSNMYKTLESDDKCINVDNTVKTEQAGVQYSPEIITIDEEIQSYIDKTAETEHGRLSIQKEDVRNSKIRIVNLTPDSNNLVSNNPVDDNFVAFMNKGDVVNLRLMIEVRNVDNRNIKYKTVRKSQSVTNIILRPQKESQNNIEDEVLIQSKSLQSLLETENSQSMHADCNPKVVVVQCGCRQFDVDNDMSRVNASSMYTCNKRYFILLPKSGENTDGCKRDEDIKQNADINEGTKDDITKSMIDPVKQTVSEVLLEKIIESTNMERRKSRDMETISRNNSIPPQTECTSIINVRSSEYGTNTESTTDEYIITKHQEVVKEDRCPESGFSTGQRSSVVSERTEYIVRRKSSIKEPIITYTDDMTQTDISDILLEARRHDDGRYTFHLPPLYMLKQYQL